MMKKVSVIIPCYNAQLYITKAVLSVMDQTYRDLEIICIDDGSTDNTFALLQELALRDERLIIVRNEANLKLIRTLNKGVDLANGDYIARMDSDDIAFADRIEKQVRYMENNNLSVCGTYAIFFSENGNHKIRNKLNLVSRPEAILLYSFFDSPLIHPSVMSKAEVLKRYKYKEEESTYLVEDYDLWIRMLNGGEAIGLLPEYLLLYRINELGESKTKKELQSKNHILLSEHFIENYLGFSISAKSNRLISGLDIDFNVNYKLIQTATSELNHLYNCFIEKNEVDKIAHKELKSWLRFKYNYILLNGFKYGKIATKIYLLPKLILNIPFFVAYFVNLSINNKMLHKLTNQILR